MATQKAKLTRSGYQRLREELEELRAKRSEVIAEVKVTREEGDLRENAGYHAAREAYAIIEAQLRAVEAKLADAVIIDEDAEVDEVIPGVPVTVQIEGRERPITYTVVDASEMDYVDNPVSNESPLGEALLGLRVGDVTEAELPTGWVEMKILSIGD